MTRISSLVALVASLLGLLFASYSTFDYAKHLDRRLHDIHCSIIPGAPVTDSADACRAAMYSPYSALMKEKFWGGVPISLFAVGAFCFFVAFSLYLVVSGDRAPRKAVQFFALATLAPVGASLLMFFISLTKLGTFCLICVGIYISSTLLGVSALLGYLGLRGEIRASGGKVGSPYARPDTGGGPGLRPDVGWTHPPAWLVALALFTLAPAVVYASAMPDHRPYLGNCGSLKVQEEAANALIKMSTPRSTMPTTLFEDPMCPTCKAFHERLLAEDVFDKLKVQLSLFPLDSECNWMLTDPLHPGACIVAKAVICGGSQARQVLEWAYENQEVLTKAGKQGKEQLRAVIQQKWGPATLNCMDEKQTAQTLNRHLHFAADNGIPVSTPQMYFNGKRFCDEDTDIGLRYTLGQIAPEVLK
ncbi:MAG TPA: vitamin K epoxide reductase family protein [Polyangiaceae bacterium]|nr:vitamin K epoxide reductase family protein [Polyangiaceae bacterium]